MDVLSDTWFHWMVGTGREQEHRRLRRSLSRESGITGSAWLSHQDRLWPWSSPAPTHLCPWFWSQLGFQGLQLNRWGHRPQGRTTHKAGLWKQKNSLCRAAKTAFAIRSPRRRCRWRQSPQGKARADLLRSSYIEKVVLWLLWHSAAPTLGGKWTGKDTKTVPTSSQLGPWPVTTQSGIHKLTGLVPPLSWLVQL